MKISMNWIRQYADIPVSPAEYESTMIMPGTGVEGIEYLGEECQNVVVGRVLTCRDHENSDHLHVCTVDVGQGEPLQIVCGAPNVREGILVPVALIGAKLPGGHEIKKGKLRGVESCGMLCSGPEIGVPVELYPSVGDAGLLIFHEDYPLGTDVRKIFGLDDYVADFEILANRPDCLCAWGIARETSAALGTKLTLPEVTVKDVGGDIADHVQVTVEDFVKGQLQIINVETARQIGRMHARAHEISLRAGCHVDYPVLFDALGENDLFSFAMLEEQLPGMPDPLRGKAENVLALCHDHQAALSPLAAYPRCATQGDLSDCNLYRTSDGEIGMFDFNNCGDAVPLVDAIMQGIFVSRLMDYGQEPTEAFSLGLLRAYLEGYESIRPLTAQEKELARHMDALCAALWRFDLVFGDDSLKNLLARGDMAGADALLDTLLRRAQWRRPLFQGA